MRVITGTARGTNLMALEGEETRPTADKVKEALFSMIQFEIEGRTVLDLFAGSGQLGLEALSRGAEHGTFIDQSRQAVDIIVENARKTHLIERCRILVSGAIPYLRSVSGKKQYDIIFLDPPYGTNLLSQSLREIADSTLLAPGGTIVCECDTELISRRTKIKKDEEASLERVQEEVFGGDGALMGRYQVMRTAVYGRTRITLLSLGEAD